jgi:hypothetical protein
MTKDRPIEIADCGSYITIIACSARKMLNSYQRRAPEVVLRQCCYLPADGSGVSATGLYCLHQAAHTSLLIIVSKLNIGKEPQ